MKYTKSQEAIDRLTPDQRRITQEAGTERPFTGEYNDNKKVGIMAQSGRRSGRYMATAIWAMSFLTARATEEVCATASIQRLCASSRAMRWMPQDTAIISNK